MLVGGRGRELRGESKRENFYFLVFSSGKTIHAITDEKIVTGEASVSVPAGGMK